MAPAAKARVVPEGLILSEDKKEVHCTLCHALSPTPGNQVWWAWTSLASHLRSKKHDRAVEHDKETRTRAAAIQQNRENDLAQRRQAQLQFTTLRDVVIPDQTPLARRLQTNAETELWEELAEGHGAGFDLGIDKTTQQYNDLCGEMNSLWNAGIMAHDTGFSLGEGNDSEQVVQEDDEDEFLAEIMQNAGESSESS